jgi:hypothetical protein
MPNIVDGFLAIAATERLKSIVIFFVASRNFSLKSAIRYDDKELCPALSRVATGNPPEKWIKARTYAEEVSSNSSRTLSIPFQRISIPRLC